MDEHERFLSELLATFDSDKQFMEQGAMEDRAQQLLKNCPDLNCGDSPAQLTDVSRGCDQRVFAVKQIAVVKLPLKEKDKVAKEAISCALCDSLDVPAPVVLLRDDRMGGLVQTFVGVASVTNAVALAEAARALRRLHTHTPFNTVSNSVEGDGSTEPHYASVAEYVLGRAVNFDDNFPQPLRAGAARQLLEGALYVSTTATSSRGPWPLLHNDLALDHLRQNAEGSFAGFIDFGDARSGPREVDLAIMRSDLFGTSTWELFRDAYDCDSSLDMRAVDYWALLRLTWAICPIENVHKSLRRQAQISFIEHTILK